MFKIGIVGAGIIAMPHKNAVMNHAECELCAICDIVEEKAKELAEGTQANIYTDYKIMAENETLDAVILNLPHFLHKEVSVFFLEKKVNVLVEKPMANTVTECEEMERAEKENGVYLAIGHLQRYFPCYRELRKIIEEKRMGELCLVTETRNIDYFNGRPAWFLEKKLAGGGIVMNYCAHTLDKLFYLVGTEVEKVCSNVSNRINDKDIESQAQVLLQMKNGVSAAFSYCATRVHYMYETCFFFSDGVAKIENGRYLHVSMNKAPYEKIELDYEREAIADQFDEFVKLISGREADIVRTPYAKQVINVIEQILE